MDGRGSAAPGGPANDDVRPEVTGHALTRPMLTLFALAAGLAVANAYFAHPLLDVMADDLGLSRTGAGLIVGATQIGYALGLILLVPLGDLFDRRRVILVQSLLSAAALGLVSFSNSAAVLMASIAAVGLLAVLTQAFVAYAASLSHPNERGRVVGFVTSGIVIGILSARAVAGFLTDLWGWRSVYLLSSLLTLLIAALLFRLLPRQARTTERLGYVRLVASTFKLILDVPVLRVRGVLALLIFADITTLLTPLVLPLSAPPFSLSHSQVGLFGLAGVAGALAASRAGQWTDRGFGQATTGVALVLMLLAWLPIAALQHSILWLVVGVLILDFGLQAVHVANQAIIYRVRPEAQNRLTAAYMLFYSIGSAAGSSFSTIAYAHAGWNGVCMMGASISLVALIFWLATRREDSTRAVEGAELNA
ncbi:MFS transporter [Ensifer sp.]|jgi:predicted MFS family arabinose efflux permease|uniref:MFS transporter n=1 Tax=Ensifer sp. TaxID=1872086 RepID=UPI002E111B68|nr:MFS transporter [Ensifer sp.]